MTTGNKRELPASPATTSSSSVANNSSSNAEANGNPLQRYISAKEVAQHQVFRQNDMRRSISSTQFSPAAKGSTSQASVTGSSMSASNSPRCSSPASSLMAESILKVVLIGDSGVGKSNLVMRFTKNKYMPHSVQTVGFEFATKTIRVGDRRLKAQIWDTAGQERFQSLTAAYYRNAVGAMIVYDITNRSSFEHVTGWLAQVHEHSHESLVLILVGNKCDLAHLPESREVSTLEAARFAAKHSMEFLETSALDATNVVDAFKKLIVPVGRLLSPTEPKKIARLPQDGGAFYQEPDRVNTRTRTSTPRNASHLRRKNLQNPLSKAFERLLMDPRADLRVSSPSHARVSRNSIRRHFSHRIRHRSAVSV
ncbi:P-loop containing nucleoside triphosphate hydrolase [Phytophthora cactorum]|nr:P-loop containing nucleoside triphosphate hydrolase [Phytophthora cactorum]